ncbi:MAG: DUF1990 family protein [Pyrinomonadaceae bacterium]
MTFLLRQPSEETVRRFISSVRDLPYSYPEVGGSRGQPPAGYNVDHNRIQLGEGEKTYEGAVAALRTWRQFDLGWVKIVPAGEAIEPGTTVVVQAHTFGFWSLNACKVVYLIEEKEPAKKFGFAYGTLPNHVERGEERFTVEWHTDDSVWYDIYAFSRPQHLLVRFASPVARTLQRRFARDSLAAMVVASR